MPAIADYWESERGLMAIVLIIGSTVLAAMKVISADAWLSYTKWIFTAYAATKTVTGVVGMHTESRARKRKAAPPADAATTTAPA